MKSRRLLVSVKLQLNFNVEGWFKCKMFNKKGQFERLYLTVFYLGFLIFILFALLYYVNSAASGELGRMQAKVREVALGVDMLYNVREGNLSVAKEGFEIEVDSGEGVVRFFAEDENWQSYRILRGEGVLREVKLGGDDSEEKIVLGVRE